MKYLLITGGSAGIGASTAERFVSEGYGVINLSRRPSPIPGVAHLACDLGSPEFVAALEAELAPRLTEADTITLVHNAARMASDSAADTESRQLREVFEINLVAPNSLNRFCLPFMKAGSSIIYVGSTLSEKAVPNSYSYVVSKHAVIGMMRATCQDLAGRGVHTACVCPGFTDTEMLREHVPADAMDMVRAMSAFNRLIEPAEIASTIFWAATHPVINGSVIHANLGQIER
jgi:3-oxoacyl-[acyl-carrier protein] reductase